MKSQLSTQTSQCKSPWCPHQPHPEWKHAPCSKLMSFQKAGTEHKMKPKILLGVRHLPPVCEATHICIPWFSWWYLQPGFINWTWSSKIKAYLTLRLPELNRKGNRRKVTEYWQFPFSVSCSVELWEPEAAATCSRHLGSTCHYVLPAMTGSSLLEGKIKLSSMTLLIRDWVKTTRKHHMFS